MSTGVVNDVTGEAFIQDDKGRKYGVLFDLAAVQALERMAGKSAIDVLNNPGVNDCIALIVAGTLGYGRRNPGSPKVNGNLAARIFEDAGGYRKVAPTLIESLSCAECLGLSETPDDDDEGEAGPLGLPTSSS